MTDHQQTVKVCRYIAELEAFFVAEAYLEMVAKVAPKPDADQG